SSWPLASSPPPSSSSPSASSSPPPSSSSQASSSQTRSSLLLSAHARSTHGQRVELDGWHADADGDALAVLATRPHAVGQLEVVADHAHGRQRLGAVADQVDALEWRPELAVFDQVALGQREHEVAVGDVDLAAGELLGVHAP